MHRVEMRAQQQARPWRRVRERWRRANGDARSSPSAALDERPRTSRSGPSSWALAVWDRSNEYCTITVPRCIPIPDDPTQTDKSGGHEVFFVLHMACTYRYIPDPFLKRQIRCLKKGALPIGFASRPHPNGPLLARAIARPDLNKIDSWSSRRS